MVWVRYTWTLDRLGSAPEAISGYSVRLGSRSELDAITDLVLLAYRSDPIWAEQYTAVRARLRERIGTTLGAPDASYVVADTGAAVLGVSGVARWHRTRQHLLTGPCVGQAHRGRGVGTRLLWASLLELQRMGVTRAHVYTAAGSLADRYVYPKFGSEREVGVEYPAVDPPN
jgi:GNAT superfamily N-acetyltransferase